MAAITRRSIVRLLGTGLFALGLAACWSDSLTPSASVTTLTTGWEKHFTVEWTVESQPGGVTLRGSVTGSHGARAEPMRLLPAADRYTFQQS